MYHAENVVTSYPSYADAERDGFIERGWIPAFVPRSARDLFEVANLDSNRWWLRFQLPRAEALAMTVPMKPLPLAAARAGGGRPPRWEGRWLPELLSPDPDPSGPAPALFQWMSQEREVSCLA